MRQIKVLLGISISTIKICLLTLVLFLQLLPSHVCQLHSFMSSSYTVNLRIGFLVYVYFSFCFSWSNGLILQRHVQTQGEFHSITDYLSKFIERKENIVFNATILNQKEPIIALIVNVVFLTWIITAHGSTIVLDLETGSFSFSFSYTYHQV